MAALRTFFVLAALAGAFYYLTPHSLSSIHTSPFTSPSSTDTPAKFKRRIVAVGDIHGDLPHAMRVLRLAGLVDLRGKWIGKTATLVQTGDIVDRGTDTIAIYRMMDRLRVEADLAGGAVVSLLGNHEFMNALGDWRYVTKEDIATFGGERARRKAMSSQGWIGQTWMANYSTTARVPYGLNFPCLPAHSSELSTNPYFLDSPPLSQLPFESDPTLDEDLFSSSAASFVHGGITAEYARMGLTEINRLGASLLNRTLSGTPGTVSLPPGTPREEAHFYGEHGPLWHRGYALEEDDEVLCEKVEEVTQMLKVRRLVMGHTPMFEGIVSRCEGKILLIDTGISSAYGGALSALEISYSLSPTIPVAASADQKPPSILRGQMVRWVEREVVTALQEGRPKRVLARRDRAIELPAM